jgi:cephalosporin-C deacetylase
MPLLFDLPVDALASYKGLNPRPDDFDPFWDRGLKEMRKIRPQTELRPAAFQVPFAECFDLFFNGVGGARVHAKLIWKRKARKRQAPPCSCFTATTGNSGRMVGQARVCGHGLHGRRPRLPRAGRPLGRPGGVQPARTHRADTSSAASTAPPDKPAFPADFLDTAQLARSS